MFFGLDWEKFLLILVVAALLVGPERLPRYAEALARLTMRVREWLQGAKSRVKEEMGEDFDDVEWRKLDPRQYDPRRIIRDALLEDAPVATVKAVSAGAAIVGTAPLRTPTGDPADVPFDTEAT
ncbi:Sec-independent protein translocase TatB [uncultured Microbacterium sp.]|uniref:Sec-independent protein secretion pathway component protein n=1 Tax=uncultured Microbacterium sp. TaxID=191216 RepID=A0A1Y5P2Y7_9MICO|nr:Sec-independent protein translocase TatB [uncultured Microbacterium sp.]SBS70288.1 Sec-independent protein secretion pathway component protein [uncultured Microbacterium sp.]